MSATDVSVASVPRVLSLESRRASEIEVLIRKLGGQPTVAPSMQEVPLDACPEVMAFGQALFAGEIDAIVLLTGVGSTALLDRLAPVHGRDETIAKIDALRVFIRGPKPAAVLKKWNVHVDVRAPEPNTWHDLVAAIDDSEHDIAGLSIAVQEYGKENRDLHEALRSRGATVHSVPVYRWQLPDDQQPLREAVTGLCDRDFDLLLITSAQQIRHLLQIGEEVGRGDDLRAALQRTSIASIGPTATETLHELGLSAVMEPSHPKMGHLVRESIGWFRDRPRET